jgi:predicted transcriptional regulator of viral defense system
MQTKTVIPAAERALKEIAKNGGMIGTGEALTRGIQFRTLKKLVDENRLEQITRGLYRLADKKTISNPDLFAVAARVPKAVVCLISALSYHDITTQIPHKVYIALERKSETPRLKYPPLNTSNSTSCSVLNSECISLTNAP